MSATAAAATVAGWLRVTPEAVTGRVAREELELLARRLVPETTSATARLARRAAGTLLPLAPHLVRRSATTVAKRVRERIAPPEPTPVVSELPFVKLARRLAAELGAPLPAGRVELSHDVDWPSCYAFVPKLAELERARGLRSTFLFLTGDAYRIERSLLDDLRAQGFLIGLHGWTHDVAIGFRSRERIKDDLLRAREALGIETRIFRAPGLGASPVLFEVLDELGFEVDGSLRVQGRKGSGTGTIFPYKVPGLARLEERPLALQDDRLFRDLGLDDDQALPVVTSFLDETVTAGGTFVWNSHPTLAAEHLRFTERLLDHAKSRSPVVPFGAPA